MPKRTTKTTPYIILSVGLIAVSTAAIFIRLAQQENMPSLIIAVGRLSIASIILTIPTITNYREEIKKLNNQDLALCILSGVVLGIHFATWITSLEYTSVIASVVLVTTNPLFVALLSAPLLGEKITKQIMLGIVLAFGGGILVSMSGDAGQAPTRNDPLLGNSLAIVGAIAAAIYFIIGRRVRRQLSLIPYIWIVYGSAAIVLSIAVIATGQSVSGYSTQGYLWIVATALIPQLIGHSSFNYALGYLSAAYVSLVVLGEPIGSSILAGLIFQEIPTALALVGSIIILMGIAIASQPSPQSTSSEASSAD